MGQNRLEEVQGEPEPYGQGKPFVDIVILVALYVVYRGGSKGLFVLLSRTQAGQAEQLSKSRKKFLATTYKPLFPPLYFRVTE